LVLMVLDIRVRRARGEDAQELTTFNCAIARETEGRELCFETVRRGVCRGLQQGAEVTYYVAEAVSDEDVPAPQVVGCLMLTREWSDWRDGWLMWLQSVYVAQPFRGRGVFRKMLSTATEDARQLPDVVGLRLYVEHHNEAAQSVYLNLGFQDSNYRVLEKMFADN
jgi:ribosomal protein S18 acetylase RimI-like enzyme